MSLRIYLQTSDECSSGETYSEDYSPEKKKKTVKLRGGTFVNYLTFMLLQIDIYYNFFPTRFYKITL